MEDLKKENKAQIIEKGKCIFKKGQPVTQIMFLLKGSVRIENEYRRGKLRTGDIMGLTSLEVGKYIYDYIAEEDVTVFAIYMTNIKDVKRLFQMGKDYKKYTVACIINKIKELISTYRELEEMTDKLIHIIRDSYQKYLQICDEYRRQPCTNKEIDSLEETLEENNIDSHQEEYFMNLAEIPQEVNNAFFSANEYITMVHVEQGARLAGSLHETCNRLMDNFLSRYKLLIGEEETNLFSAFYLLGMEVMEVKGDQTEIAREIEKIMVFIFEVKGFVENSLGIPFKVDKKRMYDIYKSLKSASKEDMEHGQMLTAYSNEQINTALDDMKESLKKILKYSEMDTKTVEEFEAKLTKYRNLPDQNSSDDETRKLRREISAHYYKIYEKVFLRYMKEKNENRLIRMFLDFGFMDEKMIEKETAVALYYLDTDKGGGKVSVFTMSQWLKAIYEGKREPSKSEFDLDYREHLRERKKIREITEKEEIIYLKDGKMRVRYEIENMFTTNNRITNGKLSMFCPILKQSDFIGEIARLYLSYDRLEEAFNQILKIDFSAFHREIMYQDLENKIEKVYIQKQVLPDVVLMPNVGENGIMWQEISDHKRDAPGRFILPVFLLRDLDEIMTYMVGCFRWELCRTIQGVYWNDIREKSLTSEYSDYVQFYRKNRDLSEEVKQKVKLQLQKCRNRTREMFAKDYNLWVRYEYTGSVRLNKVARSILFTYCPFTKEYRDKLVMQPMYQDAAAKYERERQKEVKRIRNMYMSVKKSIGSITPIMEESLRFLEES